MGAKNNPDEKETFEGFYVGGELYRVFNILESGRNERESDGKTQLQTMLQEGYRPISVDEAIKLRLSAIEDAGSVEQFVWNNPIITGSALVCAPDGRVKVAPSVDTLVDAILTESNPATRLMEWYRQGAFAIKSSIVCSPEDRAKIGSPGLALLEAVIDAFQTSHPSQVMQLLESHKSDPLVLNAGFDVPDLPEFSKSQMEQYGWYMARHPLSREFVLGDSVWKPLAPQARLEKYYTAVVKRFRTQRVEEYLKTQSWATTPEDKERAAAYIMKGLEGAYMQGPIMPHRSRPQTTIYALRLDGVSSKGRSTSALDLVNPIAREESLPGLFIGVYDGGKQIQRAI